MQADTQVLVPHATVGKADQFAVNGAEQGEGVLDALARDGQYLAIDAYTTMS